MLASESTEIVDVLKKEYHGGLTFGYSTFAGAPELLLEACQLEIDVRKRAMDDEEDVTIEVDDNE